MICWVGQEIESNLNYQNNTLFIKASNVDLEKLISILKTRDDIESLYFGAGSVDLEFISGTVQEFLYLKSNYYIVLEVIDINRNSFVLEYKDFFNNIILNVPEIFNQLKRENVTIKYRGEDKVDVINMMNSTSTSIHTLDKTGLFTDVDTMIYNDEE